MCVGRLLQQVLLIEEQIKPAQEKQPVRLKASSLSNQMLKITKNKLFYSVLPK